MLLTRPGVRIRNVMRSFPQMHPGAGLGGAAACPQPAFEWFVAWRHLRDPEHHSRKMLYFGLALLGMASSTCWSLTVRRAS